MYDTQVISLHLHGRFFKQEHQCYKLPTKSTLLVLFNELSNAVLLELRSIITTTNFISFAKFKGGLFCFSSRHSRANLCSAAAIQTRKSASLTS